ncbi:hypothetical protein [Streptomyces sp. R-74717]|uniref:hypothetical protein n=1 Tax=Streptomyces sp. R-74717 TaxID=2969820 RepID=UPI0039B67E26
MRRPVVAPGSSRSPWKSLVLPSTVGSESLIVVRYAFDAGPDGPPLSLMDTITEEIRPIDDSGTSGGVGSSVAP